MGVRDVIITNLAAEENRILNIAVGDQVEYKHTVNGQAFTVNNDGTISTANSTPNETYLMPIRIWDFTDDTYGTAAIQTITISGASSSGVLISPMIGKMINPMIRTMINS